MAGTNAKARHPRSRVKIDQPVRRISQVRKADQPIEPLAPLDDYSARPPLPRTRTSRSGRFRWCPFCNTALRPQPFACDDCNPKWKKLLRHQYLESQKTLTAEQRAARRFSDVSRAAADLAKATRDGTVAAETVRRLYRELDRAERAADELPASHPIAANRRRTTTRKRNPK